MCPNSGTLFEAPSVFGVSKAKQVKFTVANLFLCLMLCILLWSDRLSVIAELLGILLITKTSKFYLGSHLPLY